MASAQLAEQARQLMGQGRYDEAQNLAQQILAGNPKDAYGLGIMGGIAFNLGRHDLCVKFMGQSLAENSQIAPHNACMALALTALKRLTEAIPYYENAIQAGVHQMQLYTNLAFGYFRQGELQQAIQTLEKAQKKGVSNAPQHILACYTMLFEFYELSNATGKAKQTATEGLTQQLPPVAHDLLRLYLAIQSWYGGEVNAAKNQVEQLSPDFSKELKAFLNNPREWTINNAFLGIMRQVLTAHDREQVPKPNTADPIYMVGDSHCLSPAWQVVEYKGEKRQIAPRFIRGCKAYHLIADGPNSHRIGYLNTLDQLPKDSVFIVCVGEIDCRLKEGILPNTLQNKQDFRDTLPDFIQKLVHFIKTESAARNLTPILYGTPAPSLGPWNEGDPNISAWLDLIAFYNKSLKEAAVTNKIGFIDTYTLTVNDEKTANGKYHFDPQHLGTHFMPDAFQKAFTEG